MVSVYPEIEQLQNFDVKQLNSVVTVYPDWVNFALQMQRILFHSVHFELHLNKFAELMFQEEIGLNTLL